MSPWNHIDPEQDEPMPDGSVECGQILAQLASMKEQQRQHAIYVHDKIDAMEKALYELSMQNAEKSGEDKALAALGKKVFTGLLLLGGFASWIMAGGGASLKRLFDDLARN